MTINSEKWNENWYNEVLDQIYKTRDDCINELKKIKIKKTLEYKRVESILDQLNVIIKDFEKKAGKIAKRHLDNIYKQSAVHTGKTFGVNLTMSRIDTNALDFIAKYNFDKIKDATNQLKSSVRNVIVDGFIKGTGQEEMAYKLSESFGVLEQRAQKIIRTETTRIISQGKIIGAKTTRKPFLCIYETQKDERVRPLHRALQGKIFDPEAYPEYVPPPHVSPVNCRCYIRFIRKERAIEEGKWVEEDERDALDRKGIVKKDSVLYSKTKGIDKMHLNEPPHSKSGYPFPNPIIIDKIFRMLPKELVNNIKRIEFIDEVHEESYKVKKPDINKYIYWKGVGRLKKEERELIDKINKLKKELDILKNEHKIITDKIVSLNIDAFFNKKPIPSEVKDNERLLKQIKKDIKKTDNEIRKLNKILDKKKLSKKVFGHEIFGDFTENTIKIYPSHAWRSEEESLFSFLQGLSSVYWKKADDSIKEDWKWIFNKLKKESTKDDSKLLHTYIENVEYEYAFSFAHHFLSNLSVLRKDYPNQFFRIRRTILGKREYMEPNIDLMSQTYLKKLKKNPKEVTEKVKNLLGYDFGKKDLNLKFYTMWFNGHVPYYTDEEIYLIKDKIVNKKDLDNIRKNLLLEDIKSYRYRGI